MTESSQVASPVALEAATPAKVTAVETLHCDAGWRNYHFCKISTDAGIVGWSEFDEGFGSPGVSTVIGALASRVVGQSVNDHERIYTELFSATRPGAGSVVGQGLGAIENALLDAKAKALGIPVYDLLGGRLRDRIRVYWSHCGTWRIAYHKFFGNQITDLAGVKALGEEVRESGFTALKTNIFTQHDGALRSWAPGFGRPWSPELNAEPMVLRGIHDVLAAFRDHASTQIASLETLIGLPRFLPFFREQACDVAIVDAVWNGTWQSMKVAAAANGHEVHVAPHNFYGHLSTMMSAHFATAVPNLRIMETDIDRLPWDDELFTVTPKIEDGHLIVPATPGWGTEPNEEALAAHPAKAGPGFLVDRRP